MKNRLITNSTRTIKRSFARFVSLMVMSTLGVFAFSGLQATAPDMMDTLDGYLDDANTYDIKVVSTQGLSEDDCKALKKLEGIQQVEGSKSVDTLCTINNKEVVLNVASMPQALNTLTLVSGRLPENDNEIVVEDTMMDGNGLKLNDTITLDSSSFKNQEVKIVGVIDSALYFNFVGTTGGRGRTSIGSGTINYYAYMSESNFKQDYYSYIYVQCRDTKSLETGSDEYISKVESVKDEIDKIKDVQQQERYESLLSDNTKTIEESKEKAYDKLNSAKEKLEDAKSSLDDALDEINSGKNTLDETKVQLDQAASQLTASKNELDSAKAQLDEKQAQLNSYKEQLDASKAQLDNYSSQLTEAQASFHQACTNAGLDPDSLDTTYTNLNNSYAYLQEMIKTLDPESEQYASILNQMNQLQVQMQGVQALIQTKNTLTEQIRTYNEQINTYNTSLQEWQENQTAIQTAYEAYNQNVSLYESKYAEYQSGLQQYQSALLSYESGVTSYNENKETYESSLSEYKESKEKVDSKIEKAYDRLDELEEGTWYVYDRSDYSTYTEYIDDASSISNLAAIFPVVFFAVAVLISLISMNRMVEDDRTEIGTLKSLGFSNGHILIKYLLFSFMATVTGGMIGGLIGITYLPHMINNIYTILFSLPELHILPNALTTTLGILISIVCVCGSSIYTVNKELKEKPSELMRPKAPKKGKRILLERMGFWKRLKFSQKITVRNIFRYKKRVLVTIFGIAGCTALMLCGFGIKDSIIDIPTAQYGHIFTFDGYATIKEDTDLSEIEGIESTTEIDAISVTVQSTKATLFVCEDGQSIADIINLEDASSNQTDTLQTGECIITEKMAALNNIEVGDTISIMDLDNHSQSLKVSAIVNNYVEHYIYIDRDTYDKEFKANLIYFHIQKGVDETALKKEILKNKNVVNVSMISSLIEKVDNMLKSLDKVVYILIILSALLSFVVLYNLSNININERKREIATLKVLGFYDKEVDNYITKENWILTVIGILFGLLLGIVLTNMVVSTVEIEKCRFIHQIKANSYLYSSVLSIVFTAIVNEVTHFSLKRIDMIESLKSVE